MISDDEYKQACIRGDLEIVRNPRYRHKARIGIVPAVENDQLQVVQYLMGLNVHFKHWVLHYAKTTKTAKFLMNRGGATKTSLTHVAIHHQRDIQIPICRDLLESGYKEITDYDMFDACSTCLHLIPLFVLYGGDPYGGKHRRIDSTPNETVREWINRICTAKAMCAKLSRRHHDVFREIFTKYLPIYPPLFPQRLYQN